MEAMMLERLRDAIQYRHIDAKGAADVDEFHYIQPTLTDLIARNKLLMSVEPDGQFCLAQA